MKFIIVVEGKTEKNVIEDFLQRYLNKHLEINVGVRAIDREGVAELIKDLPAITDKWLDKKHSGDVIGVFGFADLYGLPVDYPKSITTVSAKIKWAKSEIEKSITQKSFRMFFAVHELEAWLLSDLSIFPTNVKRVLSKDKRKPENVNFDEPPAKLLKRVYYKETNRNYKKVTNGKQLFKNLNPEIAAEKCPNLKKLLNEMLTMAESAIQ